MSTDYQQLRRLVSGRDENGLVSVIENEYDAWLKIGEYGYILPYNDYFIFINKADNTISLIDNNSAGEGLKKISQLNYLLKTPMQNIESGNREFILMLSLTSRCSLRCKYCYIEGGDSIRDMNWENARVIIDYVLKENNNNSLSIAFHGEGEPSMNWDLLTTIVSYVESNPSPGILNNTFSISTNGILDFGKIKYLRDHNFSVSLSVDCLTSALNITRPSRDGSNTYKAISHTIQAFDDLEVDYGIRSTICEDDIMLMSDTIKRMKKIKCHSIRFEPVISDGRYTNHRITGEFHEKFYRNYKKALILGLKNDILVTYSGCDISKPKDRFCSAIGNKINLCLSTNGIISSCYSVLKQNNSILDMFIYGSVNNGEIYIDKEKLNRLMYLDKYDKECNDCYIKEYCAGDCKYRRLISTIKYKQERCFLNRRIAKDNIFLSILCAK